MAETERPSSGPSETPLWRNIPGQALKRSHKLQFLRATPFLLAALEFTYFVPGSLITGNARSCPSYTCEEDVFIHVISGLFRSPGIAGPLCVLLN